MYLENPPLSLNPFAGEVVAGGSEGAESVPPRAFSRWFSYRNRLAKFIYAEREGCERTGAIGKHFLALTGWLIVLVRGT